MDECGAEDLGDYFRKDFPAKCIDTLDVAVKKMIKLNGEKDNQVKYALGIEWLIQTWHCSNDITRPKFRKNVQHSKTLQFRKSTERDSALSHPISSHYTFRNSSLMLPITKDKKLLRTLMIF